MKSWNDYKNFVKNEDSTAKQDIEEMEELAGIVGAIIEKRNSLGLSPVSYTHLLVRISL